MQDQIARYVRELSHNPDFVREIGEASTPVEQMDVIDKYLQISSATKASLFDLIRDRGHGFILRMRYVLKELLGTKEEDMCPAFRTYQTKDGVYRTVCRALKNTLLHGGKGKQRHGYAGCSCQGKTCRCSAGFFNENGDPVQDLPEIRHKKPYEV